MNDLGFTMLEVLMVLLVMAVLAGVLAPPAFKLIDDARESATRKEMEGISRAITGSLPEGQYGYVGDMGGFPAALADLNTNPNAPAYNSNHLNGVGMGWNGPYVNQGYAGDDFLKDAWTRKYLYNPATGQLTSFGSDGLQATDDDLVIPASPVDVRGDISINVMVANSNNLNVTDTLDDTEAAVWVYYADNGSEGNAAAVWDDNIWAFSTQNWDVHPHQGVHAVKAVGLGDYAGNSAVVNAVVTKGTTSVTLFLGAFNNDQVGKKPKKNKNK